MRRTAADLWACPSCRVPLMHAQGTLSCGRCTAAFPLTEHGVPVFVAGALDRHACCERELAAHRGCTPWIAWVVLQSLLDSHVALDQERMFRTVFDRRERSVPREVFDALRHDTLSTPRTVTRTPQWRWTRRHGERL